ncbi:uncharacterized protein LOC125035197 [Penaeus chinensis]|uniref:uncharacterized protein LOC125035197 n=1 Tax=Penaeus chinensis TaxID=139456 RepID=UPI001FB82A46|nr:uncharacterized protein LOC125035197 [Penaeus chinensis]
MIVTPAAKMDKIEKPLATNMSVHRIVQQMDYRAGLSSSSSSDSNSFSSDSSSGSDVSNDSDNSISNSSTSSSDSDSGSRERKRTKRSVVYNPPIYCTYVEEDLWNGKKWSENSTVKQVPPLPPLYNCTLIRDMVINTGREDTLTDVCNLYQKLDLDYESIEKIKERSISLLSKVNELASSDQSNKIYKIGPGVYYISKRDTVIKFLQKITNIQHFLSELFFGLIVKEVRGTVPIYHVYPEAFCYEMPFMGLSLNYLLHGGIKYANRTFLQCIAEKHSQSFMYTKSVDNLLDTCTRRLVKQLPYVMAEMINILTRLNNQQIIYLDIKPDNFAIDINTGQPYLIDMGLMTFVGTKYADDAFDIDEADFKKYPQSPPELLRGEICESKSMTYGMAYNVECILYWLSMKGYNVDSLSENHLCKEWLQRARNENINKRPKMSELINIIQKCFPLSEKGKMKFEKALTCYSPLSY